MNKSIYLTVRVDVEVPEENYDDNDYIVQELNYNFSSFDENVQVTNTEICGVENE